MLVKPINLNVIFYLLCYLRLGKVIVVLKVPKRRKEIY
jgi:hypothetical protein